MYFYGCLLHPAIKQTILKELPACMSLALVHGYSYVFSPSITDKTTTQAGAARRQVRIFKQFYETLMDAFHPSCQQNHLLHILVFSSGYLRNLLRIKRLIWVKLFALQVLELRIETHRATGPGRWF